MMDINSSLIFSIAQELDIYNRGYNFFLNNEINNLNLTKNKEINIFTGEAVYFESKFRFVIEFNNEGKVLKKKCSCKFFREYKKVCKHIIAGLIKYNEKIKLLSFNKYKVVELNFKSDLISLVFNEKLSNDYYFYVTLIHRNKHYRLTDIFFHNKKIYLYTDLELIFCIEINKLSKDDYLFFTTLVDYWKQLFKDKFLVLTFDNCYIVYLFFKEIEKFNKFFLKNINYLLKNKPLDLDVFKTKNQLFFEIKNVFPKNIKNNSFSFQGILLSKIKIVFQRFYFLEELLNININNDLSQNKRIIILMKIFLDSIFFPERYQLNFLKKTYKNEILKLIPKINILSKLNSDNQIINSIEFIYNFDQKNFFKNIDDKIDLENFLVKKLTKYLGRYDTLNKNFVLASTNELLDYFKFKSQIGNDNCFITFFNYPPIDDLVLLPYNKKNKIKINIEQDKLELNFDIDELNAKNIIHLSNVYQKTNYEYFIINNKIICFSDKDWMNFFSFISHLPTHDCEIKYKTILWNKFNVMHISKYVYENNLNIEIDKKANQLFFQINNNYITDEKISPRFKNLLFPYQIKGVKWLKTLYKCGFGGILADEMGLGKTVQVSAFISDVYENSNNILKSLIIAPASLVYNWKEELLKYASNVRVGCITGDNNQRKKMLQLINKYQVIITSKDYFLRDIKQYLQNKYEIVIIDEAQNIKNYKTRLAINLKKISAANKFALSGTPIENRLDELWSIFDFIMPGFLYKYVDFKNRYIKRIVDNKNERVMNELKTRIRPFILQRFKKDVLKDLPEKIEYDQYVEMVGEQKLIYSQELEKINGLLKPFIENKKTVNKGYVFSAIMKLKQICDTLRIFDENYKGSDAKYDACIELVKNFHENNKKVLFFSQFVSVLKIIQKKLDELKIPYFVLTSKTNKKERTKLVKQFNEINKPIIFLISLKAGGVGLNLTAAEVVIHYDLWWNSSVQNQATDRAHRIGQTKNIEVYRLIVKDSIEEKIVNLQLKKKQLSERISTNIEKLVDKLSIQDLLNLFN